MGSVKNISVNRYVLVKPKQYDKNKNKNKNKNITTKRSKENKYKGQWYIIKEKKINILKDLHIKIVK